MGRIKKKFKSYFEILRLNKLYNKPSVKERLNSQIYYAHIINRNKPELLKYTTDHGFAPKYLFYPFSSLFVGSQVYVKRKISKWEKYKEFNSEEWAEKQFKENIPNINGVSDINIEYLRNSILNNTWRDSILEIRKALSFQLYYNTFEK